MKAKFPLGRVVATAGIQATLSDADKFRALAHHAAGDWGDLCAEDAEANRVALVEGERLLSAYRSTQGRRFWIITEADRSVTTFLFPEEY